MNHFVRKLVPAAAMLLTLAATGASAQNVETQDVEIQQTGFLHTGSYLGNFYTGGYAGNTYTSGALTGNSQYGAGPNL